MTLKLLQHNTIRLAFVFPTLGLQQVVIINCHWLSSTTPAHKMRLLYYSSPHLLGWLVSINHGKCHNICRWEHMQRYCMLFYTEATRARHSFHVGGRLHSLHLRNDSLASKHKSMIVANGANRRYHSLLSWLFALRPMNRYGIWVRGRNADLDISPSTVGVRWRWHWFLERDSKVDTLFDSCQTNAIFWRGRPWPPFPSIRALDHIPVSIHRYEPRDRSRGVMQPVRPYLSLSQF